jgi:hypothetical protein
MRWAIWAVPATKTLPVASPSTAAVTAPTGVSPRRTMPFARAVTKYPGGTFGVPGISKAAIAQSSPLPALGCVMRLIV